MTFCPRPCHLLGVAFIALATLAGCSPDMTYELTAAAPTVRLPADEAPHNYGGEWWYYTGRLLTDDNRAFGVELVIFHRTIVPMALSGGEYAAHYAVLDETTGRFTYDQWGGLPTLALGPSQPGFDLRTPIVRMRGLAGQDHLEASMADGGFALALDAADQRGPILHGDAGYVPFGPAGTAFYYSRPRMQATGTMTVDGQARPVSGTLWFDRQWGYDITDPSLKWDWYSLRLDDGSSVMLFVFRDGDEPVAMGTYIPPAGDPVPLPADAFTIQPTDSWRSPRTGRTYPTRWSITIPSQGLALNVAAVANDQELVVLLTTFNIYWEGLCNITGTRALADGTPAQPVTGYAYVELTNYPRQ